MTKSMLKYVEVYSVSVAHYVETASKAGGTTVSSIHGVKVLIVEESAVKV